MQKKRGFTITSFIIVLENVRISIIIIYLYIRKKKIYLFFFYFNKICQNLRNSIYINNLLFYLFSLHQYLNLIVCVGSFAISGRILAEQYMLR